MTKHFEYIWKLVKEYSDACEEFGFQMGVDELNECRRTEKNLKEALEKLCAVIQTAQTTIEAV